ncbi:MAG TPA: hypothetical protein VGD56_18555 [Gemmatirosa sp.]
MRRGIARATASGGDRCGSALIAVLVALVVAMLTATAAAMLARAQQDDARGAAAALRARTAAEGALATVLAAWPASWSASLAPGASDTRTITSAAGTATVRALRLDGGRFLLSAEASSGALAGPVGDAVRRVGLFAQFENVRYDGAAALVAAGPFDLTTDTEVRALDAAPPGWSDCTSPPESPVAAAAAAPTVRANGGAGLLGAVLSAPAAWVPPSPERFGDVERDALAARADVVVSAGGVVSPAPRATGGAGASCVRDATSWGEPYRGAGAVGPCTSDYPVIHLRGPGVTTLRGPARLQGTLIVDGSLNVVGRVEIAGLAVVGGTVQASSGALVVDGGLLVRGTSVSLGPGSRVRRSRCALDRAAAGASRAVPLARRAWVDIVR